MQIVIDMDEKVFTRLFDIGIEDYAIVNDDLFRIAKSIRTCIPLDKIRAEIEEERKGYPPNADEYKTINKVLQIINKYKAESEDRPKGRWIDIDCQSYTWQIKCPFCNHSRSMMSTQGIYPNYCENCGAKMEV